MSASSPVKASSSRVVVVGAGFAGLSAARELSKAGLPVVVLEARDRVGGRAYTKHLEGGLWVDVGGQWAGPTQDRLLSLIAENRLPSFSTWTKGDNLVIVDGKSRRYRGTIPKLPLRDLLSVGVAQWRLERMSKKVPLDAPWSAPRAADWDRVTLGQWLDENVRRRAARRLLDAGIESVFAAGASEMSLLHALFYVHSGKDLDMLLGTDGGAQATRVDGGMQQVAEKLATGLDVRLSCPVTRIVHGRTGAVVHFDGPSGGGTVPASHVVVAIPPKLVAALAFDPPLTGPRTDLVKNMPMGAVIKHTAFYDEPFWRADGLSGMSVSDEGPIHVVFDNSPPSGRPGVLMGFSEAANARRLGKLPEDERRDAAIRCFARVYGDRARRPLAYADHVWENDPWSGGCYGAFMPPGVWTSFGPAIRAPIGRIHWAGTETAVVWSGYIDGAISSGVRAATEILAIA